MPVKSSKIVFLWLATQIRLNNVIRRDKFRRNDWEREKNNIERVMDELLIIINELKHFVESRPRVFGLVAVESSWNRGWN